MHNKMNRLTLFLLLIMLCGCNKSSGLDMKYDNDIEIVNTENSYTSEQINSFQEKVDRDIKEWSEDSYDWYINHFADDLQPMVSNEEYEKVTQIEWEPSIRPYMEYDWINDDRIDRVMAYTNMWTMQLMDMNEDGQPEMLISEYFYNMEDYTHIYSIQNGKVIYCGKVVASCEFDDNSFFTDKSFLPTYYIDVYRNSSGEYRYLSCDDILYQTHGDYQIYEITFDGNAVAYTPLYALSFFEDSNGNMNYQYAPGEWLVRDKIIEDDENYTEFSIAMSKYMDGYEKQNIPYIISEYRVPGLAGELPEEQQDIVRKNIIAGLAKALGYQMR